MNKFEAHSGIVLLGVVHGDPHGFKRTTAFLRRCRPDLVMAEISPFALEYRQRNAPRLYRELRANLHAAAANAGIPFLRALKHPPISRIGRQLHLPFEYRATAAYCREFGAEVLPVDCSDFSRRWIDTWPELISTANLETLLKLDDKALSISRSYDLAAQTILGRMPLPLPDEADQWQSREERISETILASLEIRGPIRPVYIGGWQHLTPGGPLRSIRDMLGIELNNCLLLDRGAISE